VTLTMTLAVTLAVTLARALAVFAAEKQRVL